MNDPSNESTVITYKLKSNKVRLTHYHGYSTGKQYGMCSICIICNLQIMHIENIPYCFPVYVIQKPAKAQRIF